MPGLKKAEVQVLRSGKRIAATPAAKAARPDSVHKAADATHGAAQEVRPQSQHGRLPATPRVH